MAWEVPGFDQLELIGVGGCGEVWRSREKSSGQVVALRRLAGSDRQALTAVQDAAVHLRSLRTEHLVRLRGTTRAGGDDVLVLDHAAAGSLADLIARHGALTPGEVVTALAPIAAALAEAHAVGLAHGRLTLSEVLLTDEGKPLLDGLALTPLWGSAGGSAHDVEALARLVAGLLGPAPPAELARVLEAVQQPGATAATLASGLLAAHRATPIAGLVITDPRVLPPRPDEPRDLPQRRPRRWILVAAAVVGLAALVARTADHNPSYAVRRTAPPSGVPRWQAVLTSLDQAREVAFAAGDPALLAKVYLPGPALTADSAALAWLRSHGERAVGLTHLVVAVRVLSAERDLVQLAVAESLQPFELRASDGTVLVRTAAGPAVEHRLTLRRTPQGWRVEQFGSSHM